MTLDWNWPQYLAAVGMFISLLLAAHFHGKPKTGKWEFWPILTARIFWATVLYYGGFWK